MSCPVVEVIKEIRGGGIYIENDETHDVMIGGNDTGITFVCDEMSYYITLRKMEFARFELSRPDLVSCERRYNLQWREYTGITYAVVYDKLIKKIAKNNLLYNQFTGLINLIHNMEETINAKILALSYSGKAINISLPSVILLPNVDELIYTHPDTLMDAVNKLTNYINQINLKSISRDCELAKVEKLQSITLPKLDMNKTFDSSPDLATPDEYIDCMKKLLASEMTIANYIRLIEEYHCKVIVHMNKLFDACKKLTNCII